MRTRRSLVPLATTGLAIACATAGCGASGAPPHKVSLSITAPTNGATVGVRQLQIAGMVSPDTAAVVIGGRRVPVHHGAFALPMQLERTTETITVTASAQGYLPAKSATTVSFSDQTAAEIQSARKAATSSHTDRGRAASAALGRPAFQWPGGLDSTPLAQASSAGSADATGVGNSAASPPIATTPASSPTDAAPTPANPGGGSPIAGGTSTPAPASIPLPWTPKRIRDVYVQFCVRSNGGSSGTAFCRCTYQRMARAGALRSRASLLALVRRLRRYARAHRFSSLPRFVRNALLNCAQKLPGNDPATPLPVKRLPGLSHPSAPTPAPSSPTTSSPAPATPGTP